MSHDISIRQSGFAEFAYANKPGWHRLGQEMRPDAPLSDWLIGSGLNFAIKEAPVQYTNGELRYFDRHKVLYRSDSSAPISVVAKGYKVVQPEAAIEFFRSMIEEDGYTMETAGALRGGARIWVLAKANRNALVVNNDQVDNYVLFSTSYDKSMSTSVEQTTVRVVCNNTMQMAFSRRNSAAARVTIRHNTNFDADAVKDELRKSGVIGPDSGKIFDDFIIRLRQLSEKSVSKDQADKVLLRLLNNASPDKTRNSNGYKTIMELFNGAGKGARMEGVSGTAWGLLNAVTEYVDYHAKARTPENRLNNAWFGAGADKKQRLIALLDEV